MNLPLPNSKERDSMVDRMRRDLVSNMPLTKIEMAALRLLKEQGRDFDTEFAKWKPRQNGR